MRVGGTTSAEIQGVDPLAVRANKLELVERLADDLAHEIKNPLHSMVINLEVLKRRIARSSGQGTEELMRYAGILNGELERVSGRIEMLLRMIRPDRAGEPTSMAAVVDELLDLVELERERRGVQIDYTPAEHPLVGRIARETARQLVLNLLLTAIDLTPTGGTVRMATESYREGESLRLQIEPPAGAEGTDAVNPSRLAVARTLGQALGGQLLVEGPEGRPDGGLLLVLSLPAAQP